MPVSSVARSNSASSSRSSSTPVLRQGSRGAAVKDLQNLLRAKGYRIAADGDFGPATLNAVKQFQRAKGLGVDGVVGPKTWAALRGGSTSRTTSSPPPPTSRPVLRKGSHGSSVKELQNLLRAKGYRISADGDFGPATLSAVKKYQRAKGLGADGVVGPATWSKLLGTKVTTTSSSSSSSSTQGTPATGWNNGRKTTIRIAPVGNGQYLNVRAAQSYKNMVAAARRAGVYLSNTSGYRTYSQQQALYRKYGSGRAARPGYSDHQMGMSMDIGGVGGYNTRAYRWLAANARKYGFVNNVRGEYWHWTFKG